MPERMLCVFKETELIADDDDESAAAGFDNKKYIAHPFPLCLLITK